MREIKFRAWDSDTKEMINLLGGYNAVWIVSVLRGNKPEIILMQYTGLRDKKTLTDIYEGDIIDMDGNIRGNIYESPEVYKSLTTSVVAGMGYEDWENTKQRLVRQGKFIAEQSNLPQILRELGKCS